MHNAGNQPPGSNATRSPLTGTLGGENLAVVTHVGDEQVNRHIIGYIGEADGDGGTRRVPAIYHGPSTHSPANSSLQPFNGGGGDFRRSDGEPNQLGEGIHPESEQVVNGYAEVIQNEIIPVINCVIGIRRTQVYEKVPGGERSMMMRRRWTHRSPGSSGRCVRRATPP